MTAIVQTTKKVTWAGAHCHVKTPPPAWRQSFKRARPTSLFICDLSALYDVHELLHCPISPARQRVENVRTGRRVGGHRARLCIYLHLSSSSRHPADPVACLPAQSCFVRRAHLPTGVLVCFLTTDWFRNLSSGH